MVIAKAIKLEYLKFKGYKPFWIIIGLFTLAYFAVGFSVKSLLDWFLRENGEISELVQTAMPLFDFVDIWQNLGYVTFLFKYILGFVVIISICLEYSVKTIRQNVIDGISYQEYLLSKLGLVGTLSVFSGILLFLLGIVLGLLYSPVRSLDFILMNAEFVLAYIYETFLFLCFAMLIATLIRRTGFAIVIFVIYTLALEPIATGVLFHHYEQPVWYFPAKAIGNMIRVPFPKYILREVQDYVAFKDILVATVWGAIFIFGTFWLMRRRDV